MTMTNRIEYGHSLFWGPLHTYGNCICAMTLRSQDENLVEFAAVPISPHYGLSETIKPIVLKIKSHVKVDYAKIHIRSDRIAEFKNSIIDEVEARTQFEMWCEKYVRLSPKKKLFPLVYDWSRFQPTLKNWLGCTYEDVIGPVRDLQTIQNYSKDRDSFWGEDDKGETLQDLPAMMNVYKISHNIYNSCGEQAASIIKLYEATLQVFMPGYKQGGQ